MPALEKLDAVASLTDQAHRSIKRFILAGILDTGERLTESFFADQLGISKSPVREALNALQNEGLLRIEPRKGVYVHRFSAKEITDLYELREALEVFATQTVEVTGELVEGLRKSLERTQQLLDHDDKAAYIEEDILFHQMIVNHTGNEQLSRVHANIQDKLWLCRCQTYQLTSPDTPSAHKAITDALASFDRGAAREATQAHIRFVRNALLAGSESLRLGLRPGKIRQASEEAH
jgi:DNA-binding GntR family transcriptional regulator